MICLSRLSTASCKFRVLCRLTVILSLRRIRDPSARRDKLRILRLRSQARFAQDDIACEGSATQALDARSCGSFDFARRLASLRMTFSLCRPRNVRDAVLRASRRSMDGCEPPGGRIGLREVRRERSALCPAEGTDEQARRTRG